MLPASRFSGIFFCFYPQRLPHFSILHIWIMVLLYIQLRCTFLHPPPVCRVPNGCSCCLALFTFVINFPPCLSFLLSPCSPGDPHPQSPVCPGCPLTLQCDCHLVHFFHCHQEFGLEAQFSKPHKLLFYSFFFF